MYFLFYIFWIEEEFIVPHERRDIFAVMNHVSRITEETFDCFDVLLAKPSMTSSFFRLI